MSTLKVDLELVQKYNVAGPRYTSYPPATKFTDAHVGAARGAIEANNRTARDLSLYFHIPFCETLCWFCGCTTVITLNHDKGTAYVEYLGREVAAMAPTAQPAPQGRPTPLRRRFAHVSAPRRNPPARRHHPQTLHASRPTSKPAWRWTRAGSRATTWSRCAKSASTAPRWACRISIRRCRRPSTASSRAR